MSRVLILNKPYGVVCRFSGGGAKPTLRDYVAVGGVYPAGRLDADSEGLVVLTDDGRLQATITAPSRKIPKTYWAQVEGVPGEAALAALRRGVTLNDGPTLPAGARSIGEPDGLWPRDPPVRFRKTVPTAWIELTLREGRNRQVRRMTALVGFPTLRLVRVRIGPWTVEGLVPGRWREVPAPSAATLRAFGESQA
jgi:23S rRNA pseudouridine2457 synthase